MAERIPVERLAVGDLVQAVKYGPQGTVTDADRRGWTLVQYRQQPWSEGGAMPYKHGQDRLILLRAASRDSQQTETES